MVTGIVFVGFSGESYCGSGRLQAWSYRRKKPWSNENFPSNDDFHFIIIPDRAGGERKGIFEQGLLKAARLRPDFIMSVGDLIDGMWKRDIDLFRAQWTELKSMVNKVEMPFFYVVGNHDINRYA